MNQASKHIRNGIGAVRPFVYGRLDLLDSVKHVFDASEVERNAVANGFHVQARIGDSDAFGNVWYLANYTGDVARSCAAPAAER